MVDRFISRPRRHFLLALGVGAGAVGATLAGTAARKLPAAPAASPVKRRGYRMTAHIGNYYRTAKF